MTRSNADLNADARRAAARKRTARQTGYTHRCITCRCNRVQGCRTTVTGTALCRLRLLIRTVDRIADAARQAERDATATGRLAMGLVAGIGCRIDHNIRRYAGQILPGDQVATRHVQRIASLDGQVAVKRSNRARVVRDGRSMIRVSLFLRANTHAQAAGTNPRMRFVIVAVLRDRILGRGDIDVVCCPKADIVRAHDRAALNSQIVARLNVDRITRYRAADADIRLRVLHRIGFRAADEAAVLDLHRLVLVVFLASLVDRDVARRTNVCRSRTVFDAVRHTCRER
ncbi:hypothetical protein BDO18943_03186 [Burkholderia dolosa]|nr:hypothetical protein BDO18943_03186 [Burkholderia dolosa]